MGDHLPNLLTLTRIVLVPAFVAAFWIADAGGAVGRVRRVRRRGDHRLRRRLDRAGAATRSRGSGRCSIRSPTSF